MKSILIKVQTQILLLIVIVVCSCSHYYYVPNVQNVPLFREPNELHLSASYGGGYETACFDIQSAYAATNKIGLMANFMSASEANKSEPNSAYGYCLEAAMGYFKPIGKMEVFEIYGGLGGGNQHHKYFELINQSMGSADLAFFKFFAQPSFGITLNAFDIAISTRICGLSFTNVNNNTHASSYAFEEVKSLSDKTHFFAEPAITIRSGWKKIKLQFQSSYSGYLNSPSLNFGENYHISGGLYFTIANRYKTSVVPTDQ